MIQPILRELMHVYKILFPAYNFSGIIKKVLGLTCALDKASNNFVPYLANISSLYLGDRLWFFNIIMQTFLSNQTSAVTH